MRGDEAPGQDEPIIKGYDTSACGVPEGVPRGLWREPEYLIFPSRLESLDAMQETAPPLAKALGVSETRAMELLMNVPKGKYLRVPPPSKTLAGHRRRLLRRKPVALTRRVRPDRAEVDRLRLAQIIADVDLLVPCWGDRKKLPKALRPRLDVVAAMLRAPGKLLQVFGLTRSGDPTPPLMLGYDTPLVDWRAT